MATADLDAERERLTAETARLEAQRDRAGQPEHAAAYEANQRAWQALLGAEADARSRERGGF
jgi:hypothetical protein